MMNFPSSEKKCSPLPADTLGFTLIEVTLVIVLLVIMSGLAVSRFETIDILRQKTSIRHFLNTWEFLSAQAKARGESYRLIVDFERNSYSVRREIPTQTNGGEKVDRNKNFRLKSELARMAQEEQAKLPSLDDEFKEEELRQGEALENIYYQTIFRDPHGNYRLGIPIEFPSLTNDQFLTSGLRFRDVMLAGKREESGQVAIRFSATGASEFAVVHFESNGLVMTAVVNPATGKVDLRAGDIQFDWGNGRNRNDSE